MPVLPEPLGSTAVYFSFTEPTEGKRERVQEGASSCQSVKSHTWLLCLPEVLRQDTGRS